ncbi:MAG: glutamine--fructose-6-phosphate transaminase (isomerizing) [Bacilli bacterium]|nr:glutamine--fructose-6-phosphate transaminase (isomerizing) [Bacilli bacterium]
MCGIVGYNGKRQAGPILLEGLTKLEYRGYDSAGIAVRLEEKDPVVAKAKGRLSVLSERTHEGNDLVGTLGIGHTRWATHGEPSENNAHPHISDDHNVTLVHNGIIENYAELKEKLLKHKYKFYGQTDSEVAAKLIDYYYKKYQQGPLYAITHAMRRITGSYAFAVMFKEYPGVIFAARNESPLVVGVKDDETFLASDVTPIIKYTKQVYFLDNMQVARIEAGKAEFFDIDQEQIEIPMTEIMWDVDAAERGGYEHFMIKEIHEQPRAVADTLNSVLKNGKLDLDSIGITDEAIKSFKNIHIVACGSAYHVGVVGQYVFEDLVRVPVRIELASEYRYRCPVVGKDDLVIIISQSGETADSLAALRLAKQHGATTLGIVNVIGSSIAREANHVFYTLAGPEIAVATTKAYSAQLIAIYALAMNFALAKNTIIKDEYDSMIEDLKKLPEQIETVIKDKEKIQWFASKYAGASDMYFIGRGIDYGISLEGSLKMKEISYVHSEAYAAGEIKHGPISLIEEGTLVVGVATQEDLYKKIRSNMVEVQTRGAKLYGITNEDNKTFEDISEFVSYIPTTSRYFTTSLAIIPLQLLSYYLSVAKGLNVDKPRNLAKSVTVE